MTRTAAIAAASLPNLAERSVWVSRSLPHRELAKLELYADGHLQIRPIALDIISIFRPESAKQAQREKEEEEREAAKVCRTNDDQESVCSLNKPAGSGDHQPARRTEIQWPHRRARTLCAQLQVRRWRHRQGDRVASAATKGVRGYHRAIQSPYSNAGG